jgi:hypothetical protein
MYTNQTSSKGCANSFSGLVSLTVAFILGWLVYHSANGGFWCGLLWLALCTTALLGFVPIIGPFIYWKLATATVMPYILNAAGLQGTWLTTLGQWLGLVASIMFTIASIYFILVFIGALSGAIHTTPVAPVYPARYTCPTCGAYGDEYDFPDHICPRCHSWVVQLLPN